MSFRQYALHRGCSHQSVMKAVSGNRISVEEDGSIIASKADAEWEANTDPSRARQKIPEAKGGLVKGAPGQFREPTPEEVAAAEEAYLMSPNAGAEAKPQSNLQKLIEAERTIKVAHMKVKLDQTKRLVVSRPKGVAAVFELARRERETWAGWPTRVAALMASELGVEPHDMQRVLEKHVRAHLQAQKALTFTL